MLNTPVKAATILVAIVAFAASMILVPTATAAGGCDVRTVQPDGKVVTTKAPEGATKTLPNGKMLTCSAAEWTADVLTRTARIDAVTVNRGEVSIDNVSFSDSEDISMDEFAGIMRNLVGMETEPVDRGLVAVDDGTDLTDKQIATLLADPNAGGGPRVLLVVNSPGPADTFQHFRERAGSDDGVHVLARRPGFWGRVWRWIVVHVRCGLRPRVCSVKFTW
jgi:hypothetical protein